ncbi:MAG: hypothetical protein ACK44W_11025, partial [Planctomycetota bacterium]
LVYYVWGDRGLLGILGFEGVDWATHRGAAAARVVLRAALERMVREGAVACEALVEPELRPRENEVYREAGFQPTAAWAIYGSARPVAFPKGTETTAKISG